MIMCTLWGTLAISWAPARPLEFAQSEALKISCDLMCSTLCDT